MTVAAFFDMDRTILNDSSGRLYLRYLVQSGQIGASQWPRIAWWLLCYLLGLVDFPRAMVRMMLMPSSGEEEPLLEEVNAWFEKWLAPHITTDAVRRIEQHRELGHRLVVLSAATVYMVRPLAERLGVPNYLCTHLELLDGRFTGHLVEPVAYGHGKVQLAEQFARDNGIDLQHCVFYSDGHEDVPMLERVGQPVAVNPDRRLRRLAEQRGWPIEAWS
jgi:putative phosphoserine phosphatase/1-acylglycerol-3-phosphate O-acyltransferase